MIGFLIGFLLALFLILRILHHGNLLRVVRAHGIRLEQKVHGYRFYKTLFRTILILVIGIVLVGISENFWAVPIAREQIVERRDCIIAIDISQSMRAREGGNSRLHTAQKKVTELIKSHAADRYALYVFAGDAVALAPLTADSECIELFLRDIDEEMIAPSTTSLAALLRAILEHDAADTLAARRTVLILSDGEDFSENLEQLTEESCKRGIRVISWAIGSDAGVPIPIFDERGNSRGHLKTADGAVVISRREDQALKDLAEKTHGIFVPQTTDSSDVESVCAAFVSQRVSDTSRAETYKTSARIVWAVIGMAILEWMIAG